MEDTNLRERMEAVLTKFYESKFKFESDFNKNYNRVVMMKRYQVQVTLVQTRTEISYDIYADLAQGIYEIGDMNVVTNIMLNAKRIARSFGLREMNTTERLYPADRRGKNTQTSGL